MPSGHFYARWEPVLPSLWRPLQLWVDELVVTELLDDTQTDFFRFLGSNTQSDSTSDTAISRT